MDSFFSMVAGKIVSVFVMWAMLGIILWFGAQLPVTSLIVKPMFGVYVSVTKQAATGAAKLIGEAAAFVVKFALNALSFIVRTIVWVLDSATRATAARLSGSGAGAVARSAPTYRPMPEWINHFPPPKKKKGGGGH